MKKTRIIIILIIITIASVSFFTHRYFLNEPKENIIKIGYQPYWPANINIIQAMKHLKLLENKGYKPEYTPFLSGPPINEALAAGDLDIGFGGDMPTISVLASGMKVKVLAATAKSSRQAIVVDKEKIEQIKDIKDLAGKKVAVVKGSCAHYFLQRALEENRIDSKNIAIINMNIKDQAQALVSNQIDACVTWEPWPTRLEKEGLGKIILEGEFSGYIYAREDFMNKNPEALQTFLEAMQEGLEYSQANLGQTSKWAAEETDGDHEIIYSAAKTDRIFQIGETIKIEPKLIEELKEGANFLLKQDIIKNVPDFSQKIDLRFVDRVIQEKR